MEVKRLFCSLRYMSRIFVLFLIVLLLFHLNVTNANQTCPEKKSGHFKLGLENIPDNFLLSHNIGLITNQTGKAQSGKRNIELLLARGLKLKKIFTPEHGISGVVHTDKKIADSSDECTQIPIISLFSRGRSKQMNLQMLENIDVLMFDIQDSGMRHYTYISTMFQALEIASKYKKKFVVLDRPNILGPCMEGPLVEKGLESFISFAPIALRHGMTVGELAIYYNKYILKKPVKLYVVKMKHYKRDSYEHNSLLTHLSSGIKTLESCHGYSFLGLLGEIKPFHVGLRTPFAFQSIFVPDTRLFTKENWMGLCKILDSYGVEGVLCRICGKRNYYTGLKCRIKDVYMLQAFQLLIKTLVFFKDSGLKMEFSKSFDRAVGTNRLREFVDGKITNCELEQFVNNGLNSFYQKAKSCFLYQPLPKINYLDLSSF